jgi:hypothetical protein
MNKKNISKFSEWLHRQGSEILPPTNEWELLRFRCKHGVGVIYCNKKGVITLSSAFINDAYKAWKCGGSWSGKFKRLKGVTGTKPKAALLTRDGDKCFYCGKEMNENDITEEHVLSLVHGGSNRMENKVLAHEECNRLAGNLSIIEKIKLRDSMMTKERVK